jgi:phosphate transport system substrate-binding protein
MTNRRLSMLLTLAAIASAAVACSGGHGRGGAESEPEPSGEGTTPTEARGATLSLKGSDTMVILAQRFAEGYMHAHPGATIQVSGGGSGTGISALLDGTTDVADSSRPITDREREDLRTRRHVEIHETRVALDALAVYVNQASTVPSLSLTQLSGIYRGEITNWSAVGGPDAPIVLYSRENNSGTYAYFKEHVLGGADFAAEAQTLPGTAAVINAVSHDPNGIGYGGIGYAEGVRVLPVAADGEPIPPTLENAVSGRYPISRYLFMYTAGEPTGAVADLLAWVVTPEGQALVTEAGFYPLPVEGATPPTPTGTIGLDLGDQAPALGDGTGLGATGTGLGGS